jgi:hypothetical protein
VPVCTYPLGCKEFAMKNNVRCAAHLVKNKADKKEESAFVQKQNRSDEAARQNKLEREARDLKAAEASAASERLKELQLEVIRQHKLLWNGQVDNIVAQVMVLRQQDPNANAGDNAVGNTQGGSLSPLTLSFVGPSHGVGKGDVTKGMTGFDDSWSGIFKFRRSGVLVHCS